MHELRDLAAMAHNWGRFELVAEAVRTGPSSGARAAHRAGGVAGALAVG